MLALIDGKLLRDAVLIGRIIVIPARFQFLQTDRIGAVPIHLVRAHVDKDRLRHIQPGRLQHVQGRLHRIEVIEGPGSCQIMARLGRRVNTMSGLSSSKHFSTAWRSRMSNS